MLLEQDIFSIALFGLIVNFVFSIMFGILINRNVGIVEVMKIVRDKKQPWYYSVALIIPFAKAILTLYRVYILQIHFLNKGKSYRDFLIYITK